MRIKALIFDVDGTLADTEEAHRRAFNRAFEEHGLDWNWSVQQYARLLSTTGGKERIAAYIESLAATPAERAALRQLIPALHATKTHGYTRLIREGAVPLRPGIGRLIEEAAQAGVRLAIATTTTFVNVDELLRRCLGPEGMARFGVIGAGERVERKKPAGDIYESVLRELNEPAGNCVAIEDSANGLCSAKSAGLFTVITPTEWTRSEDFSAADLVLPSFGSFERPLALLEDHFTTVREWGWRGGHAAWGDHA
jgi:beta-phosphoglucomutase-like phosphatase (HAD superfamily)